MSKDVDDRCHVYIVNIEKAAKVQEIFDKTGDYEAYEKALSSTVTVFPEFITKIGEEELTTKHFIFPNSRLIITASIFYTDESLASHPLQNFTVNDQSMIIGVVVTNKKEKSALSTDTQNASITEVTYDEYTNIVRAKQFIKVRGRKFLIGLQCDCMAKRKEQD
ncbi:MAG: hypothetical protein JSS81_27440 [Acidobacteria bacterium]|nr:hypothetical protein [Acidobacteriota bacterium]